MDGGGERGAILKKGGKGREKMGKNAAAQIDGGGERGAILKKGEKGRKKWEKMKQHRWKEAEKEVLY